MLVREILFSSGTLSLFESSTKERWQKKVLFLKQEDIAPFGCAGGLSLSRQSEEITFSVRYII